MRNRTLAIAAAIASFALSCPVRADPALPTAAGAIAYEQDLAKAFTTNDPNALAGLLASDWIVVSARGSVADRDSVIDAVRKHQWVHTKMAISETRVRMYGNTGVVTYRLANAGVFGGKPFDVQERETDVLLWNGNAWQAVLSHESFLNE